MSRIKTITKSAISNVVIFFILKLFLRAMYLPPFYLINLLGIKNHETALSRFLNRFNLPEHVDAYWVLSFLEDYLWAIISFVINALVVFVREDLSAEGKRYWHQGNLIGLLIAPVVFVLLAVGLFYLSYYS